MNEMTLNWQKLPSHLSYLAEPAVKYGHYQFDDAIAEFFARITEEEKEELIRLIPRVYKDGEEIELWLDRYDMKIHLEARLVYFMTYLLMFGNDSGALGANFEPPPRNTVEDHIASLGKHGSYRLASGRMFAARHLAKFGQTAQAAIPALRRALQDDDLRVCVWAHYALALIEGNREEHEQAIRAIYAEHDETDDLGCHDDAGEAAAEALEKFSELSK